MWGKRVYLAPKVLVVDEFGIWPYDREAATAFFTLVSARYERGIIILTSNKGFGEWGELLGHPGPAAASQPRAQHLWRELPAPGETARRALQFAPPAGGGSGERQRQLPRLTEWLGNCTLTESLSSSDKMGQLYLGDAENKKEVGQL